MLRIREYRKVESLEEAYELNQKKTNRIIGGGLWMKIGDRNLMTAIDLSGLGLDQISETEDEFVIGCMATLLFLNEFVNAGVRDSHEIHQLLHIQQQGQFVIAGINAFLQIVSSL